MAALKRFGLNLNRWGLNEPAARDACGYWRKWSPDEKVWLLRPTFDQETILWPMPHQR